MRRRATAGCRSGRTSRSCRPARDIRARGDLHLAFLAPTREIADAFWRAGTEAGHPSDGAPGPRPQYRPDYYGAFLLDPDGNSVEAAHHGDVTKRGEGHIDHLWVGVADLAASRAFYETIAPYAGLEARDHAHLPDLVQFRGPDGGSCSFVADGRPVTRDLHLAFGAPDRATVDAFHRAATEAGYTDNGPPGERPEYHPGYYGAFVLDPDGTNVEVVFHDRR